MTIYDCKYNNEEFKCVLHTKQPKIQHDGKYLPQEGVYYIFSPLSITSVMKVTPLELFKKKYNNTYPTTFLSRVQTDSTGGKSRRRSLRRKSRKYQRKSRKSNKRVRRIYGGIPTQTTSNIAEDDKTMIIQFGYAGDDYAQNDKERFLTTLFLEFKKYPTNRKQFIFKGRLVITSNDGKQIIDKINETVLDGHASVVIHKK